MRLGTAAWAIAALVLLFVTTGAATAGNLVVNGGFERDSNADGIPDGWQVEIHTNEGATGAVVRDTAVKHSGQASVRIDHTSQKGWVRISQFDIPARPQTTYRFSAWVRGKGRFICVVYTFLKNGEYETNTVVRDNATDEWREVAGAVTTGAAAVNFKISLITDSPARVWFDDVSLETIASVPSVLVPTVAQGPKIDGELSDGIWKTAVGVSVRYVLGGEGKLAPVDTQAWMARDEKNFYVAFRCSEPELGKLPEKSEAEKLSVWSQDRVEAFLMGQDSYVHIGVTPYGRGEAERVFIGQLKLYPNWHAMPGSQTRKGKPKFACAGKIGDREWSVEKRSP